MVLLHVKKGEESLFLHSCTLDDPVSEVSISHFLLLLVHTTDSSHDQGYRILENASFLKSSCTMR